MDAREAGGDGTKPNSLSGIFDGAIDPISVTDFGDGNSGGNAGSDSGTTDTGEVRYNKDGSVRKKRGRQPGSGSGASGSSPRAKGAAFDLNGVTQILLSIHGMLAMITKEESFALTPDEAKALAEASNKVAEHYDVAASAKALAWTNLAMVAGSIYSSRAIAIYIKQKRSSKREAEIMPFQVAG